jgi:DNA-binding transcriptional ArsR family regulator
MLVGRQGPVTATELAAHLPVSRQAVVKHLDALRTAGLVDRDKHGRDVRYGLRPTALHSAAAWMDDVGAAWDKRLATLARRASARRVER